MADLSKIKLNGTVYNIKDTVAREMIEDFQPNNMIPILWEDLVDLRDNEELIPGAFYRITDYNFITSKTNVHSGNHQFDIIVLALSESMVSETAWAAAHDGDTYFQRQILGGGIEWLYTVYVDHMEEDYGEIVDHSEDLHSGDVFVAAGTGIHPDSGDEVPILYKTNSEEYDLDEVDYEDKYFYEGTYDFDGDDYDMWAKYELEDDKLVFKNQYALTPIVVEDGELITSPLPSTISVPTNLNAWELKYCLNNDKGLFDWASTDGKGIIYYMKDEFGNEAPYDFKNALFQRKNITNVLDNNVLAPFKSTSSELNRLGLATNYGISCGNSSYWYYTFNAQSYSDIEGDASLSGYAAYNTIKPYIIEGQRLINDIVLGEAKNNQLDFNCYNITIWGQPNENILKGSCHDLLCSNMSKCILEYTYNSTFNGISSSTFGSGCSNNIGYSIDGFIMGKACSNNNFGMNNLGVKTGNSFTSNSFGSYCYGNEFGDNVTSCNFSTFVSYNKFGRDVSNISLPSYTRYCTFEDNVKRITFNTSGGGNNNYLQYVTVKKGAQNYTGTPLRNKAYEQVYFKQGLTETAI